MDTQDELMSELFELIEDLGFDFDRLSNSGQVTYDRICSIIAKLKE